MDATVLRSWWFCRQGLGGKLAGAASADVLARTGWIRSVGGVSPYLGLRARNGASRAAVDADVGLLRLHELPSARGCTYVLPAAHFATGLLASQGDAAEVATAKKYLGVTDAELATLDDGALVALEAGPLDPAALREALGERVRSLGAEGKKRGQTTTLPLSLGRLQGQGRIRRVPVEGRLDRQRYAYARWEPGPLAGDRRPPVEIAAELARLYFAWVGFATPAQFQAFSGLGVKAAKAAIEPLALVSLCPGDPRLAAPEVVEELRHHKLPTEEDIALVGALDGYFLLRREVEPALDPADVARQVYSEKGPIPGGRLMDLSHHAILDRGRLLGFWEWDALGGELVWATFSPPSEGVRAAVAAMDAFIRAELGDARIFSLDSPQGRGDRLRALRNGFGAA